MNLLEPRGQGVGAENPDGACLVDLKRTLEDPRYEIDSPRTTEQRITTEVTTELESAIKSLNLEDSSPELDRDFRLVGRQDLFSEITLSSNDSDNSSSCSIDVIPTTPLKREGSSAMEAKLFVTPPSDENSDDKVDARAIRLEKWFFFSPVSDENTDTMEKT